MGDGKIWFQLYRLLDKPERLVGIFRHRGVGKRERAQVQVVGIETVSPRAPRPFDLGLAERRLDDTGGTDRDLVLKIEHVSQRPFEAVCPKMCASEHVN